MAPTTMRAKIEDVRAAWERIVQLGVDASAPIESCIKALVECADEQQQQIHAMAMAIAEQHYQIHVMAMAIEAPEPSAAHFGDTKPPIGGPR